jgi:TonB family protein
MPEHPQMVAPPDVINNQPPDHARFESDEDNTVLKETVNQGVPHPAPPPAPAAAPAPRKAEPAPRTRPAPHDNDDTREAKQAEPHRSRAPALDDLFAPTDELVRSQREADRAEKDAPEQPAAAGRRRMALAVAPVVPEWSLPGHRGTFDYLPDIQRGDVTMLNTKANEFAPFVRRVGERVFQHLVIRQRTLELQQILNAHDAVEMRVTLDPTGKLKTVRIESHSGSASMDDTLSEAVNTAAFDNNPPKAAANAAGDYEFEFAAQLRAFTPGQGNVPSRIESRLSVGLL